MSLERQRDGGSSRQEKGQGRESTSLSRAMALGLAGSLIGTMAMDLVIVVEFWIAGQPVGGYLALIGSVVGGGALVGAGIHLLVGSLLGLLFGAAVDRVRWLRIGSVWKGVWLGLLAGLVTIPLGCVPFALLAGVPILDLLRFSFLPHLVWGAVLGVIAGYAMRSDRLATQVLASR